MQNFNTRIARNADSALEVFAIEAGKETANELGDGTDRAANENEGG